MRGLTLNLNKSKYEMNIIQCNQNEDSFPSKNSFHVYFLWNEWNKRRIKVSKNFKVIGHRRKRWRRKIDKFRVKLIALLSHRTGWQRSKCEDVCRRIARTTRTRGRVHFSLCFLHAQKSSSYTYIGRAYCLRIFFEVTYYVCW